MATKKKKKTTGKGKPDPLILFDETPDVEETASVETKKEVEPLTWRQLRMKGAYDGNAKSS